MRRKLEFVGIVRRSWTKLNQEPTSNPIEVSEDKGKKGATSSHVTEKKARTVKPRKTKAKEAGAGEMHKAAEKMEGEVPVKKRTKAKEIVQEPEAAKKEVAEKAKPEAKEKPSTPAAEKPRVSKKTTTKVAEEAAPAVAVKPAKAIEETAPPVAAKPVVEKKVADLRDRYIREIAPQMIKEFKYKNVMQVPRLKKIVLNIGLGEATTNAKAIESAQKDLAAISGQHPVITRAKKSIAAFKLRAGMPIGVVVTLRGKILWDFLNKFMNIVLPRIRDFQGVSLNSFDKRGNYTLGLKEQIAFPEIEFDKVEKIRGLQITIVTTSQKVEEGKRLLELMGMPFARS